LSCCLFAPALLILYLFKCVTHLAPVHVMLLLALNSRKKPSTRPQSNKSFVQKRIEPVMGLFQKRYACFKRFCIAVRHALFM
jgi:hypothetical protein